MASAAMRYVETRPVQTRTRGVLSTGISGEPPTLVQELLPKFSGAPIDGDMVLEPFNGLRPVVLAYQQFEPGPVDRRANLVHEVLAPSMKAPEHICRCFGRMGLCE